MGFVAYCCRVKIITHWVEYIESKMFLVIACTSAAIYPKGVQHAVLPQKGKGTSRDIILGLSLSISDL